MQRRAANGARELEQDDRGFYLANMKAYGRATLLMRYARYARSAPMAGTRKPLL